MSPDMQVVERVLEGHTESFRILVDRHRNKLYGVLMRLLADPQAAEEVAQDAFVKAYTRLAGFRGDSAFSTWLIQIGVHLVRDRYRSGQRRDKAGIVSLDELRRKSTDSWEPRDDRQTANPQTDLEVREIWEHMEAALAGIPAGFREVFTLRHLEHMDYAEISIITGDTPGTLKVRAHRARALLKARLEAAGIELGTSTTVPIGRLNRKQEGN